VRKDHDLTHGATALPTAHATRDFSNGFLVAEVLSRYFPSELSLHSFDNMASNVLRKRDNWSLLDKFCKVCASCAGYAEQVDSWRGRRARLSRCFGAHWVLSGWASSPAHTRLAAPPSDANFIRCRPETRLRSLQGSHRRPGGV
jgi:CH-like domain in sperm protein